MIDFTFMSIEKIIIHHVPNALSGTAPTFGTGLTQLDQFALDALTTRITTVMGRGSNCMEMQLSDRTEASAAMHVIGMMLAGNDETFISKTSTLAQKLFSAQSNNRVPGGILVCMLGRTGAAQQQFAALIKAESQSGFHISIDSVEFLADLFLTEAQRLYKIGFWVRNNTGVTITPDDLSVYVYDQNATHAGTVGLASYFAQSFLGSKPHENAAFQTEVFYNSTKDFIVKNSVFTDEQKVELTNCLHSYLKNDQSTVISGQLFANTYFEDPEIIDQYTSRLEQERFPATAVAKDVSRIKNKLKIRRMKFNSGVKISYPSTVAEQNVGDLLYVESYNEDTDYTTVKIKGRIESQ